MRRGAIVGFSFSAYTAGIVATSSAQNLLKNGNFGNLNRLRPPTRRNLLKADFPGISRGDNGSPPYSRGATTAKRPILNTSQNTNAGPRSKKANHN